MSLFWMWFVASALAQDPGATAPPVASVAEPGPDVVLEDIPEDADGDGQPDYINITVVGAALADARDNVVRKLEKLGWKSRRARDGRIIFRGPEGWMGKATLRASGDLDFSIPAIAFPAPSESGGTYNYNRATDDGYHGGNQGLSSTPFPGKEKVAAVQAEVRAAIHDDVLHYREVLQHAYFSKYISELPTRLEALWNMGESLDGGKPIIDPAARRAALLEFWSSRTDTPEGRTVSRSLEIFLREVVMASDTPVTRDEASAAELRRPDGRKLDIF